MRGSVKDESRSQDQVTWARLMCVNSMLKKKFWKPVEKDEARAESPCWLLCREWIMGPGVKAVRRVWHESW